MLEKSEDLPYAMIGRTNIGEMTILPKVTHRLNGMPMKMPMTFFTRIKKKEV